MGKMGMSQQRQMLLTLLLQLVLLLCPLMMLPLWLLLLSWRLAQGRGCWGGRALGAVHQ